MPVVPEVDVDSARNADDEHEDIHSKAHGDDERPYGTGIGDRRGGRPSKVEERKIELIQLRHSLERRAEICRQKRSDYAQPHKAHTDQKSALHRLCRLDSDTHPKHGEDDRHHHRRTETDNIRERFFHGFIS